MKIFSEQSKVRTKWDLLIMIFIFATILIIPFQFAIRHEITLVGSLLVYVLEKNLSFSVKEWFCNK